MKNVNRWSPIRDLYFHIGTARYCWSIPPSLIEWPHYKTDHRLFRKKHIGAMTRKNLFTPPPPNWEGISVNQRFWVYISHIVCMYQLWVSDEMQFCGTSFWLYLMPFKKWNRPPMNWNRQLMKSNHIIGVNWSTLCLHVTNDSRSLKWHNVCKKRFSLL